MAVKLSCIGFTKRPIRNALRPTSNPPELPDWNVVNMDAKSVRSSPEENGVSGVIGVTAWCEW